MRNFVYGALTGALVGLLLGWSIWHPIAPPTESHAAAIPLSHGAIVLERSPETTAPTAVTSAVKELPRGAKLERAVTVKLRPKPIVSADASKAECAPVSVELGIVKMPDDTRRVIATSQDGEIVGGVDIPISRDAPATLHKWAAGGVYDPHTKQYGVFLDRDLGPFRVGADIVRSGENGVSALVRVGIRF